MLRLTRDLGDAAANISQIDVSDPDNLKIMRALGRPVVTLLLGDHDFALALCRISSTLFGDQADACRTRASSICAWKIASRWWNKWQPRTQLAVGLDAGSSRTRCVICALEGDHIRYLVARPGARRGVGEGPRDRSGCAGRIDSRGGGGCRARRAGFGGERRPSASAAWASRARRAADFTNSAGRAKWMRRTWRSR